MRRTFRAGLVLGFLCAAVLALAVKVLQERRRQAGPAQPPSWPPLPTAEPEEPGRAPTAPFGPRPSREEAAGATAPDWVEPVDGGCPPTHPVKVKLSSGLYHLPGMAAYNRTNADRCYRDGESAERDGFTRAKR